MKIRETVIIEENFLCKINDLKDPSNHEQNFPMKFREITLFFLVDIT